MELMENKVQLDNKDNKDYKDYKEFRDKMVFNQAINIFIIWLWQLLKMNYLNQHKEDTLNSIKLTMIIF